MLTLPTVQTRIPLTMLLLPEARRKKKKLAPRRRRENKSVSLACLRVQPMCMPSLQRKEWNTILLRVEHTQQPFYCSINSSRIYTHIQHALDYLTARRWGGAGRRCEEEWSEWAVTGELLAGWGPSARCVEQAFLLSWVTGDGPPTNFWNRFQDSSLNVTPRCFSAL